MGRLIEETGLYLHDMMKENEDLCEDLATRKNYALVVDEIFFDTCSNVEARCKLRIVGESLISSQLALGLTKSKISKMN